MPNNPVQLSLSTLQHVYGGSGKDVKVTNASGATVTIYIGFSGSSTTQTISDGSSYTFTQPTDLYVSKGTGTIYVEEIAVRDVSVAGNLTVAADVIAGDDLVVTDDATVSDDLAVTGDLSAATVASASVVSGTTITATTGVVTPVVTLSGTDSIDATGYIADPASYGDEFNAGSLNAKWATAINGYSGTTFNANQIILPNVIA